MATRVNFMFVWLGGGGVEDIKNYSDERYCIYRVNLVENLAWNMWYLSATLK
jgi:hypothetical protein